MSLPIHSGLINSPLWYSSTILDTLEWNHEEKSGIFYYGSRNFVYFVKLCEAVNKNKFNDDIASKNSYETKIIYYMKAHPEYIVGLCTILNGIPMQFNDFKLLPRFATCGKDRTVRIWSFNENNSCCCLNSFNLIFTKIDVNPTCISINSSNIIFCGFEKGKLFSWNYLTESESKIFETGSEDVVQISWNDNKFAVAYKKGYIKVFIFHSYDSISILTKFRAHYSDICNVCWNPIENTNDLWGDLATSGKDRKIKLWKVEKCFNVKTLTLPSTYKKLNTEACNNEKESASTTSSNWLSICWSTINNGSLIVSTGFGNIGIWKTPCATELKYFTQNNFTKAHGKSIFAIKEFHDYKGCLITHSLDRIMNVSRINEVCKDGEYVYTLPCLGGSVLSLHGIDHSNMLAIGCADNLIRLWRLDNYQMKNNYDVVNVWNGINGKILAICWHPFREGLLAFGTDNGIIGCVNVGKDKKVATPSRMQHTNKVFITNWAVDIRKDYNNCTREEMQENLIIYSVGNYCLLLHDFRQNDYADVSNLVSDGILRISDFVMHDLLNYFAVGYANGLVNVFAVKKQSNNTLVCQIKTHAKGINCMRWCPVARNNTGIVHYRLAIGSGERFLTVTDLDKVIDKFESSIRAMWSVVDISETLAMFKGHGDRITGIDWCPFDYDKLVSSSYDHTAYVWSITSNSGLCSFRSHQGKVLCCKWSNRDPDLVYTGGEDSNLFAWRPSEQTLQVEFNRRRNFAPIIPGLKNSDTKPLINHDSKHPTNDNTLDEEIDQSKQTNDIDRKSITNHVDSVKNAIKSAVYTKKRTSLFPTTIFSVHHSLETYQNGLLDFMDHLDNYLPCFTLLDNRTAIIRQLELDLIHHKHEQNFDNYFILLIWWGKIGQVVSECLSINYSADWLMSIILSYTARDVPEELTKMMVNNALTIKKDPILAATYWLAMGETRKSIDVLIKNECTREAMILAKLRLAPNDPLINDLLPILKEKNFKNGCFELSAMCSVLMGDYKDVIETMGRRTSKLASWATIKIMIKYDQTELVHQCTFNFINSLLLELLDKNGDLDNISKENNQWFISIRSTNEILFYSIIIDLHQYLWVDRRCFQDIFNLLTNHCCKFNANDLSILRNQIHSKLVSKQINQSQNQIALYLTYEIMLLIIDDEKSINDKSIFNQLNDLINQYNDISFTGKYFINQLCGDSNQQGDQTNKLVQLIIEDLSNLKLQDVS